MKILTRTNDMIIAVDGVEFIFTMISITISIIFTIIQMYIRLKTIFKKSVEEIVNAKIEKLKDEIILLKESNTRLEKEVEEIKRQLEQRR
jgi:uncharacterized protein YlxW (UPF0749 family)